MALGYENVSQPVIINVNEARAPSRIEDRRLAYPCGVRLVGERLIRVVMKQWVSLVRKRRHKDVWVAIVVVVRRVHAHARESLSVFVVAYACLQRYVFE